MTAVHGMRTTTPIKTAGQDIRDVDALIYNPEKFDDVRHTPLSAKLQTRDVKNTKYERFEEVNFDFSGTCGSAAYNATSLTLNTSFAATVQPGSVLFFPRDGERVKVTAINRTTGVATVIRNFGAEITGDGGTKAEGDGTAITASDPVVLAGIGFPEGTTSPESDSMTPQSSYNYVQTFKRALEMSKTQMKLALYGEANTFEYRFKKTTAEYKRLKEQAFWFGTRRTGTVDGKTELFTGGVLQCLKANHTTVADGVLSPAVFDAFSIKVHENGSDEKDLFMSPSAYAAILKSGRIPLQTGPKDSVLGIEIKQIVAAAGKFNIYVLPKILFGNDNINTGKYIFALDMQSNTIKKAVFRPTEIVYDAGDDRVSGKYAYLESEEGIDMFGYGLDNDYAESAGSQRGIHGLLICTSAGGWTA
jgi:hypothetical protein